MHYVAAETANWGIAIAAAIVALVTLVTSTIMQSRTLVRAADAQRVSNLERDLDRSNKQVDDLEERVAECEKGRAELKKEITRLSRREVDLMRRLVNLEEDTP